MAHDYADAPHGTALMARAQTAGRGQRGNSWESEPGKNVSLSVMLRPAAIPAQSQFCISEAVALAVARTLDRYLPEDVHTAIKWPNDIYVGDKKIAGILIENALCGSRIDRSIAGIGVNINQETFLSEAPNPVSLIHFTHKAVDVQQFAREMTDCLLALMQEVEADSLALHEQYLEKLWRRRGYHPYRDAATGMAFDAAIDDIAPTGHITLIDKLGARYTYAFKEVAALL